MNNHLLIHKGAAKDAILAAYFFFIAFPFRIKGSANFVTVSKVYFVKD